MFRGAAAAMRIAAGLALTATMLVGATVDAAAQPGPGHMPEGLWLNPHRSVVVRTGPCGERLCGWIVWANAEAQADAKDSGIDHLLGTALLEEYRPDGATTWKGTVFVPDMGRRFASEIDVLSPTELKVKGCILGGLICKSQTWTRVTELPRG